MMIHLWSSFAKLANEYDRLVTTWLQYGTYLFGLMENIFGYYSTEQSCGLYNEGWLNYVIRGHFLCEVYRGRRRYKPPI